MSTHDRGAFGALLAEAKALECRRVSFVVDLDAEDEDGHRWTVGTVEHDVRVAHHGHGRTGEEALRRLVENLRG